MANGRVIHLSVDVTVPATVGESEVAQAINAALEGEDWIVGAAIVTGVDRVEIDDL
jgi:hypothetical protein